MMERQEEKEEEKKSKRLCLSSLPLDLIWEVLIRLPAKGLARFRCVSKLWLSYTTTACFKNIFRASSGLAKSMSLKVDEFP